MAKRYTKWQRKLSEHICIQTRELISTRYFFLFSVWLQAGPKHSPKYETELTWA